MHTVMFLQPKPTFAISYVAARFGKLRVQRISTVTGMSNLALFGYDGIFKAMLAPKV